MINPYCLWKLTPVSSKTSACSEKTLMPEGPADCKYLVQRFCPLSSLYNSQCTRKPGNLKMSLLIAGEGSLDDLPTNTNNSMIL